MSSHDPAPTSPENPPQESDAHSPSTHGRDARATHGDITFLWDPMRSICRQLGIAHSKLSSLSKEFSGMAAHEIADKMRAAGLREKLRAPLIEFAANLWGYPGHVHFAHIDNYVDEELKLEACDDFSEDNPLRKENDKRSYDQRRNDRIALEKLAKKRDGLLINIDRSPYPGRCCKEEIRWELFRALKRSRREPDFDRNTWAMSLGFANFARMRRACLLEYGKTPAQLEMEILIDLADFYDVAGNLKLRICSSRHRVEARGLRAEKPFIDRWSCARELRFDWLKARVAELGVSANLRDD